jgi:hypothetical protein
MAILFFACTSNAEKIENAKDKVAEAQEDLQEAIADSVADYNKFREETDLRIRENEKSIAEYRLRISKEKAEARADYEKRIAALETRNSDMRRRLDAFKQDGRRNWQEFKTEFNKDMDELGASIKDIFRKDDNK